MQLQSILLALLFVAAGSSAEELASVQSAPVVGQPQHVGQLVPVHSVEHEHAHHEHAHHEHVPLEHAHHEHGPHEHAHQVEQPQLQHAGQAAGQQHLYAPAGMIQMVSGAGPLHYSNGPATTVAAAGGEQYGKPESSGLPPNYKPFGSWGLYIGGNPADGYYSNYYKALGNSVDKQQVAPVEQQLKPSVVSSSSSSSASSSPSAGSAFGPMLRQAVGGYNSYNNDQPLHPFDYYTPADLNSGSRVALVDSALEHHRGPSAYAAGLMPSSPVHVGSQVYGYPVAQVFGAEQPLSHADSHSTKRLGLQGSKGPERVQQQQQQQQQQVEAPAKGYPQVRYVYAPQHPHQQLYQQQQQQHHYSAGQPQVVAYPVPVGSQIVGSQPGADGAYAPYGVHGYTRYALKPTVVAHGEQHYHQGVHSAPASHFSVYKQQPQQQQHSYQPLGFYGYPLNQLHYSQGGLVSTFGQQQQQQSAPVVPVQVVGQPQQSQQQASVHEQHGAPVVVPLGPQVEAAGSEKSETVGESKPKELKRA